MLWKHHSVCSVNKVNNNFWSKQTTNKKIHKIKQTVIRIISSQLFQYFLNVSITKMLLGSIDSLMEKAYKA